MVKITFSSSFKRAFKKKVKSRKEIEQLFWNALTIFVENPFDPSLRTHKLSGKLKGYWGFSVEYDLRVVFGFEDNNTKAVFMDFGKHEEVY